MAKRMIIMLVAIGALAGAFVWFHYFKARMIGGVMAAIASAPMTVSTTTAEYQDWQPKLEGVGTLRAVNGSDLSLEVSGIVDAIQFKSGDDVDAGAVLLRLRSIDDVAKLRSLEASADLAQITYDRDQKQLRVQAVSQATVDTDAANLKNARAQVAEQQAILDKKTLRAPFAGHIGIRLIDLGQYLTAGTPVVTLQALDPIFLDFNLPQQALDQLKVGQPLAALVDTYKGQTFDGEIAAINPRVDQSTRNVQIRGIFKNPERKLLPGMYATVDITVGTPQRYVTLPQTAITFSSYGDTVYLVENKGQGPNGQPQLAVRQTFITSGSTRGDQVAILTGVKEGDVVVSAGQVKLRNGASVIVNNTVQPSNDANPKPVDQ